jgi:hypothetical protein
MDWFDSMTTVNHEIITSNSYTTSIALAHKYAVPRSSALGARDSPYSPRGDEKKISSFLHLHGWFFQGRRTGVAVLGTFFRARLRVGLVRDSDLPLPEFLCVFSGIFLVGLL